jgi:hypothetical protein
MDLRFFSRNNARLQLGEADNGVETLLIQPSMQCRL